MRIRIRIFIPVAVLIALSSCSWYAPQPQPDQGRATPNPALAAQLENQLAEKLIDDCLSQIDGIPAGFRRKQLETCRNKLTQALNPQLLSVQMALKLEIMNFVIERDALILSPEFSDQIYQKTGIRTDIESVRVSIDSKLQKISTEGSVPGIKEVSTQDKQQYLDAIGNQLMRAQVLTQELLPQNQIIDELALVDGDLHLFEYRENTIHINLSTAQAFSFTPQVIAVFYGIPGEHVYSSLGTRQPFDKALKLPAISTGWGIYIMEVLNDSEGFDDAASRQARANYLFWLLLIAKADLELNSASITEKDARLMLTEHNISNDSADIIVQTATLAKGHYAAAVLVANELSSMLRLAKGSDGFSQTDFTITEFHQTILENSPAPLPVIKQKVEQRFQ